MPKITQARRDARRQQILTAAQAVFAEKGFARASTTDIVNRSGLSVGAVYGHFPSKDAIVMAVCDQTLDTVFGNDLPKDAHDLLAAIGHDATTHFKFVVQVWAEAGLRPELAQRVQEHLSRGRHRIADLIQRSRAARDLPPHPGPAAAAQAVLTLLAGHAVQVGVGEQFEEEALERVIQLIVDHW